MIYITTPEGHSIDSVTVCLIRSEILLATNGRELIDDDTIAKMFDLFKHAEIKGDYYVEIN